MSWMLTTVLNALIHEEVQRKLDKIKANLAARGWDVSIILKAKAGATPTTFFQDVLKSIRDAF